MAVEAGSIRITARADTLSTSDWLNRCNSANSAEHRADAATEAEAAAAAAEDGVVGGLEAVVEAAEGVVGGGRGVVIGVEKGENRDGGGRSPNLT